METLPSLSESTKTLQPETLQPETLQPETLQPETLQPEPSQEISIPHIPEDKILFELPSPTPKDFLATFPENLPPPEIIAETILKYFFRRKNGYEEIEVISPSGERKLETRFVKGKLPLISEVSRLFGLTKNELLFLAKKHPDSIGRAVDAALDIADENVIHNTLEGSYHPSSASLVAPFASRVVSKQQVKVEDTKKISPILDQIEQNQLPYGSNS